MFGIGRPKLPISLEQQRWVDDSFVRLADLLGIERLLRATVVLPTPDYFPDAYDRSEAALGRIFFRVATAMHVNPDDIDVTIFGLEHDVTRRLVPFFTGSHSGAGGLYFHKPDSRPHISVNEAELREPMALVAVLAHEIGHIILLRPGLIDRNEADMEPLNDLLTVFLGFGVFTANAAFRFEQYTNNESQGWSTRRLGYLSEELFGYALARFAFERGETKPKWASFLVTNIASYMKRSAVWLQANQQQRLFSEARVADIVSRS
jgi:hypothetical protein